MAALDTPSADMNGTMRSKHSLQREKERAERDFMSIELQFRRKSYESGCNWKTTALKFTYY